MTPTGSGATLRPATHRDAHALTDLERRTNTVALAHVFDPAVHRFPVSDVLDRWERLTTDGVTAVTVAVVPDPDDPRGEAVVGVVSVDADRLGHLLVEPGRWGTGLGRRLADHAVAGAVEGGGTRLELTCLVQNGRARSFYAAHGWHETGSAGRAPWPPYPRQLTYVLDLDRWAAGTA